MQIELWGVRGSIPSPCGNVEYRLKIREILNYALKKGVKSAEDIEDFLQSVPDSLHHLYGGNTTCVTVSSPSGKRCILDCGTGVRTLGDILLRGDAGKGKAVIPVFITHTHWDHIQGIPFFKPIYIPGNTISFYSGLSDLHERLSYQQDERFFPKKFDEMEATKTFTVVEPGKVLTLEKGFTVESFRMKHPGGCLAYKFTSGDKRFIFATDAEFTYEYLNSFTPEQHAFFQNADLLLIDSQYTLDEAFKKFDWGHTSYTMAVNCATKWNVKKLVLTHHEPAYYDEKLLHIHTDAKEHLKAMELSSPEIFMAREGSVFDL
jgi:phosphoribosyl 1,2-cyclic phosphodiesterase